jgi:hypothetical protein
MTRERRPITALATVALIGAIGTGCGSSGPSESGDAGSTSVAASTGVASGTGAVSQTGAVSKAAGNEGTGVVSNKRANRERNASPSSAATPPSPASPPPSPAAPLPSSTGSPGSPGSAPSRSGRIPDPASTQAPQERKRHE